MKRKEIAFTVIGTGEFPFDMLRYDRAFPFDGESVEAMGGNAFVMEATAESYRAPREVRLVTNKGGVTDGRWESFGWYVKEVEGVATRGYIDALGAGRLRA